MVANLARASRGSRRPSTGRSARTTALGLPLLCTRLRAANACSRGGATVCGCKRRTRRLLGLACVTGARDGQPSRGADARASGRPSSPRCRRWPCRPAASTSARGSPTPTARPRCSTPPSTAIRAGHNQYPPGPGIPELRQAIADHQRRCYGLDYDPDTDVLVTAGATEAIAAAVLGVCEPGDEVVMFEPYYDSYAADRRAGRRAPPRRHPAAATAPAGASTRPSCAAAITPAHPADPAQHAAQPHRQGVRRAPSSSRSPRWPASTTSSSSPTRCTSTSPSTAAPHPPISTLPGHGRAHDHHRQRRQDVQRHRLEDRLGHRRRRRWSPPCAR